MASAYKHNININAQRTGCATPHGSSAASGIAAKRRAQHRANSSSAARTCANALAAHLRGIDMQTRVPYINGRLASCGTECAKITSQHIVIATTHLATYCA